MIYEFYNFKDEMNKFDKLWDKESEKYGETK